MAIDLTNHDSLKGAVDALKTILRSRKKPIEVQPGLPGSADGPQLQLPKNVKIKPTKETDQKVDSQEKEEEKDQQNNQGQQGSAKDDQNQGKPQNQSSQQNQPGESEAENQDKESSDEIENSVDSSDNDLADETNPSDSLDNTKDPLDELDDEEETEEERQARISRITDPSEIEQDIEDIKQDKELRDGEILRAKKKALDDLTKETTGGDLRDFSSFSIDLFKAISTQVKKAKHKEDTYRRPNASYAGTDYLMPGKDYLDKKSIPVIAVYFDQSGSWGPRDIKNGTKALASIAQFERQNKIKIKLFFFANHLHDVPEKAQWEGGTSGFGEVLDHINNPANKITNAIILTDNDIEGQTNWKHQSTVNVKGCVWFLWKGGSKSRTAPKYLKGERGTFQYELPRA